MNTVTLATAAHALAQVIEVLNDLELADDTIGLDVRQGVDFYSEVTRFEIRMIRRALFLTGGSQRRAASLLGLRSTTLNSKIKQYKIDSQWISPASIQTEPDALSN
jgi:DNA-binding NtrC family response regulator